MSHSTLVFSTDRPPRGLLKQISGGNCHRYETVAIIVRSKISETERGFCVYLFQVFLVREKVGGEIYAMKVLRKDNIIKRNQVRGVFYFDLFLYQDLYLKRIKH